MTMKRKHILLLWVAWCCSWVAVSAVTLDAAKRHITKKEYAEAAAAFRTLMRNKTTAARADCNKWFGEALCMTGQYEEAVPYLEFAARKQVSGAYWYLGLCRQKLYDFEGAIEAMTKYKTFLRPASTWHARIDSVIAECEVGRKAVTHVRDVVIIDSLWVPKRAFFAHYRLGSESGRIRSAIECPGFGDAADTVVFENQAGDYRLFVRSDGGRSVLCESHCYNGTWETPVPVALTVGGRRLAFPFLRSDGETLYFASDDTPGLGGLDLYKTHYNIESEAYYTPERLGMPFNSPYDDYLLAIDETHQVGWWATERRGHPDFVTIYLFLLDDDITYLEGTQVSRARIDRLADTWRDAAGYASIVADIMSAPQRTVQADVLRIVINDTHVYTSAAQFRNATARAYYDKALRAQQTLSRLTQELEGLRLDWRTASASRRKQLRPAILQREQQEEKQRAQIAELEKKYRSLETKALR